MSTSPQLGQESLLGDPEWDFQLRYYSRLLWRSRLMIVAVAVAGLGLAYLWCEAQTPRYRANTWLQLAAPSPTGIGVTDALVGGGSVYRDRQYFNTQLKVLRSRELAQKVIARLKLDQREPLMSSFQPAVAFGSHVSLEPILESLLVELRVTHSDPEEAVLWANTLAEVYVDDVLETRVESVRRAYGWLQDRLAETQKTLREANQTLLDGYQSEDLVAGGSETGVTASIGRLTDELTATQARRIVVEAALNQFTGMRRRGQSLGRIPQVASDPMSQTLASQLAAQEVRLATLSQSYKDAHPEIQKLRAAMEQVRKAQEARIVEIEQGLRAEFRQLRGREGAHEVALVDKRAQAIQQTRTFVELETLKKEADTANTLYGVLLQKLSETNIAASVQNDNVRVVQQAWRPIAPVWPDRRRLSAFGLLFGLLLGVGFVVGRDYLNNTISDPDEVESYLGLDLLAAVPRFGNEARPLVTEAYQALRTSLLFGRTREDGEVVLITGTAPGEGKTTTALNIAKLLAVSGEKTLIVDADLRRGVLHERLKLDREPGLTDVFVKRGQLEMLVRNTTVKNLSVLTTGQLPRNPPALLGRETFSELLVRMRRDYRWIVLDSPPLTAVTDGLLLARLADMAVLVIHHGLIDRRLVRRVLTSLRKANGNLIGAVLNAVDVKTTDYYSYYYSYASNRTPNVGGAQPGTQPRAQPVG